MAEVAPVVLPDIVPFDPNKKKKKKKLIMKEAREDTADKLPEQKEILSGEDEEGEGSVSESQCSSEGTETNSYCNELLGGIFKFAGDKLIGEHEVGEGSVSEHQFSWEGTERDYHYIELLHRVFKSSGGRRKVVLQPPQVFREGTKKTVFANFKDLCKTMSREPEHVKSYILAELCTSGSLNEQEKLIIKGRFLPKYFEGILRRYINDYVLCNACKSPDTYFVKEKRLSFLTCGQCGSARSVAPIKSGVVLQRRKGGA